jgi:hypothetical protein
MSLFQNSVNFEKGFENYPVNNYTHGGFMKIKYVILFIFIALVFFLVGYKIGENNQYKSIVKIINNGNKIICGYCDKYSYEKNFGVLHINKWYRFLELKYLVYDNEIHEVNVSFNPSNGYFEGYDHHTIDEWNKWNKSYVDEYYPFLEKNNE